MFRPAEKPFQFHASLIVHLAALLTLLMALAGCGRTEIASRPDIIWVVLDAAAAGHFGLHGYSRDTTPRMDRFAEDALVWERAYAQAPQTVGSVASFLTGRLPPEAWVDKRMQGPTVAEQLQAAGYRTIAFSENLWLSPRANFKPGFDVFQIVKRQDRAETIQRVLGTLDENSEQPLLLYLHLLPPHAPYNPPPPFRERFAPSEADAEQRGFMAVVLTESAERSRQTDFWNVLVGVAKLSDAELELLRARYDENLAYADDRVGQLLDALRSRGRLAKSLIIVTSDHGEAFGQHGQVLHSTSLYDEQIRVPLIMRLPDGTPLSGTAPGHREEPAQLMDLPATVLHVLGLAPADDGTGRSLLDPKRTGDEPARSFQLRNQAIIQGRFKMILDARAGPMLFDLDADPGEQRNLASLEPERVTHMGALAYEGATAVASPSFGEFDEHKREQLEALGYLEGSP